MICLSAPAWMAETQDAEHSARWLTGAERRAVGPLALALGLRMLGLFLLLPVIAPYVLGLPGGTLELAGLAVGVYGLTQALFLIPLGWLSDRLGRKPVLIAGLLIFAAGGAMAASLEHPLAVIMGRIIQGAGAISAVVLAAVGDVTAPARRAQGMVVAGLTVGVAFGLAMIGAVPIAQALGVATLFSLTAALGVLAAVVIVFTPLPRPEVVKTPANVLDVRVLPLCFGVFVIHFAMAALFVHVPVQLAASDGAESSRWMFLVAFVISIALVMPFLARRSSSLIHLAIASVCVAGGVAALPVVIDIGWVIGAVVLAIFFAGFNFLEAVLPARVSILAVPGGRGAVMGMYSISQALGVFAGAYATGILAQEYNQLGMIIAAALVLAWLPIMKTLERIIR